MTNNADVERKGKPSKWITLRAMMVSSISNASWYDFGAPAPPAIGPAAQ